MITINGEAIEVTTGKKYILICDYNQVEDKDIVGLIESAACHDVILLPLMVCGPVQAVRIVNVEQAEKPNKAD